MGDDLRKLPFTVKLSRKALNIIKANITFAIAIKFIALLLVIPGWLTLWIAILSDMGATLLVALNGLRLMRRSEEHTSELQSRGQLVCRLLLEKKNQSATLDIAVAVDSFL